MQILKVVLTAFMLISFVLGCSGLSTREQRVLSGGAIGAGGGAALAIITGGSVAVGSALGAGAGALGGLIYDESQRRRK